MHMYIHTYVCTHAHILHIYICTYACIGMDVLCLLLYICPYIYIGIFSTVQIDDLFLFFCRKPSFPQMFRQVRQVTTGQAKYLGFCIMGLQIDQSRFMYFRAQGRYCLHIWSHRVLMAS